MSGGDLHGRAAELEALSGTLDAVALGEPRLLVVRGESGIGKTRLLTELGARATRRRFVVVEGRSTELERDVPFVAILEAIAPLLPGADDLARLGPQALGLLATVLPEIGADATPGGAAGTERWRLHGALAQLLALIAADHPLLLTVDDVHWADPATRELLEHLVRRPPTASLLVAVGVRRGAAADGLLAAQRSSGAVGLVALDLRPLARDAAEPLLAAVTDAGERDRRFAAAGGNPLMLLELARDPGGHGVPQGIASAVAAEVAGLPDAARALVRAAAVAGEPFDVDLAAGIAALDPPAALAALDTIARHELVRATADPRRFAFRHPVVRTAVYESLGAGERLAAHAAAARELARTGAPATVRARHLRHTVAPGDAEAAGILRAAAGSVRAQAPGVAADWLLAARRADAAGADLAALADVLVEAGRLEAALEVIDGADAPAIDPWMAVAGASVERLLGRHDAAYVRLERALPGAVGDATPLLAALAVGAYQRGEYVEVRRWAQQAGAATGHGAPVRAVAATLLAVGDAFAGDAAAAAAGGTASLAAVDEAGDEELGRWAEPAMAISWGLLALDRLPEGLTVARRIAEAARRHGSTIAAIPHDLAVVLALGLLGRIAEAAPRADEAEQAARLSGNPQLLQWALWLDAWILMERGDLDTAQAHATESVRLASALDDSASAIVARAVLGGVLGARGEHAEARALIDAYNIDHGWICRWAPLLVESDLALDDLPAARAHAARAAQLAPGTGMAGARAAAGRAEALVALAAGDAPAAAALALGAAEEADRAGAALEAARDRLVAGRALVAGADRDAGVAQLVAAGEQAADCGAPRVADEARRALRRAGVRVGRAGTRAPGTDGLDALSPREREVATLVADGLTNRAIGERLFLSEKTIETHLRRVFQKLGVRSRAQVAAAVARGD